LVGVGVSAVVEHVVVAWKLVAVKAEDGVDAAWKEELLEISREKQRKLLNSPSIAYFKKLM
jgi:hypothetical protein